MLCEMLRRRPRSDVIKTCAVNQCAVERKSKESRARIAGLRLSRERADFDEAETERGEMFCRRPILIESCCQSNGIRERQSEAAQLSKRRAVETSAGDSSCPSS